MSFLYLNQSFTDYKTEIFGRLYSTALPRIMNRWRVSTTTKNGSLLEVMFVNGVSCYLLPVCWKYSKSGKFTYADKKSDNSRPIAWQWSGRSCHFREQLIMHLARVNLENSKLHPITCLWLVMSMAKYIDETKRASNHFRGWVNVMFSHMYISIWIDLIVLSWRNEIG